jgi:hypothetical protein
MIEYILYRIEDDETTTPVSTHPTIEAGVMAGVDMVENVDLDYAYALYSPHTRIVAFREGRVGLRIWEMRMGRISPSLLDKWDRDEDEFIA